jgi:hypothetical protein
MLPVGRGIFESRSKWTASESAVGALIPAPGEFLLKDIANWKRSIRLSDLSAVDWQRIVDAEFAATQPDPQKALSCISGAGVWERLAAFMEFRAALKRLKNAS